jgi:RecG-like helicase
MTSNFKSLATLQSLDSGAIQCLGELGITNLGDLLGYPPFRYARFLRAAKDNLLRRDDVIRYVDDALQTKTIEELLDASTEVLRGLGRKQADILKKLGLRTIAELAAFAAVDEAEEIVTRAPTEDADSIRSTMCAADV